MHENDIDKIRESVNSRVTLMREERSDETIQAMAERTVSEGIGTGAYQTFKDAVLKNGLTIICEIKNPGAYSPEVAETIDFEEYFVDTSYDYEASEADIISCFIEPHWNYGSEDALLEIRDEVSTPVLIRDYFIEPYQIYRVKTQGADAVVLSFELLSSEEMRKLIDLCDYLLMDVLVEVRNLEDVQTAMALNARAVSIREDVIGEPVRDKEVVAKYKAAIMDDCALVVDADVPTAEEAIALHEAGVDALLLHDVIALADSQERIELIRGMKNGAR